MLQVQLLTNRIYNLKMFNKNQTLSVQIKKVLSFQFQDFPLELRIQMKKHGRNLYNNSITRKELNDQKALFSRIR